MIPNSRIIQHTSAWLIPLSASQIQKSAEMDLTICYGTITKETNFNDDLEKCVEQFHSIVTNEHYRVSRNEENIDNMRSQLAAFTKN